MRGAAVTITALPAFPLVGVGDDLSLLINEGLARAGIVPEAQDILVLAQKIVSKAEGCYVALRDITPSARAMELAQAVGKDARMVELILRESREVVKHRPGVLVVEHRLGFVMANAGIDQSNIAHGDAAGARPNGDDERALLLPRDPDASCAQLKSRLEHAHGVELGVVINDSFGRPWRQGVTGVALGAAGLPSLLDMVGQKDLFGRAMRITEIAIADEVAAAASLVMGQTDAGQPVVHIRGLHWSAPERPAAALLRPRQQDMFR